MAQTVVPNCHSANEGSGSGGRQEAVEVGKARGRCGGVPPLEGVAEIPERRGSDQACLGISA